MTEAKKRELINEIQEFLDNRSGFSQDKGLKLLDYKDGVVYAEIDLRPEFMNAIHCAHGGYICTVVDMFAATAYAFHEETGYRKENKDTTLSLNVNYLSRLAGPVLKCEARLVKYGKHIRVCQVDIFDGDCKEPGANAVVTYYRA